MTSPTNSDLVILYIYNGFPATSTILYLFSQQVCRSSVYFSEFVILLIWFTSERIISAGAEECGKTVR